MRNVLVNTPYVYAEHLHARRARPRAESCTRFENKFLYYKSCVSLSHSVSHWTSLPKPEATWLPISYVRTYSCMLYIHSTCSLLVHAEHAESQTERTSTHTCKYSYIPGTTASRPGARYVRVCTWGRQQSNSAAVCCSTFEHKKTSEVLRTTLDSLLHCARRR